MAIEKLTTIFKNKAWNNPEIENHMKMQ